MRAWGVVVVPSTLESVLLELESSSADFSLTQCLREVPLSVIDMMDAQDATSTANRNRPHQSHLCKVCQRVGSCPLVQGMGEDISLKETESWITNSYSCCNHVQYTA